MGCVELLRQVGTIRSHHSNQHSAASASSHQSEPRKAETELYINIENNDTVIPIEHHSELESQKIDVDSLIGNDASPIL